MISKFLSALLFIAFMTAGLSGLAVAAPQVTTGTIEGTVTDQSGAVLPNVDVTVKNLDTGIVRMSTTDDRGSFRSVLLPVGRYEVSVDFKGFAPFRQPDLTVTVGQTVSLDVRLGVAGTTQEVSVTSEAPLIETSRTQISTTVDDRAVANLPVNGRNFIDFVLLTPGVTRDFRTGDISFAGQRGTLNSLVVDGADNNNTFFGQTAGRTGSGRAPFQFSQDAVKEFQVNSNGYSAEYGRAGGAVVNVVTKSGTNEFHGSVFEFYRDKSLNANDVINKIQGRAKSPYHFNQFGGSVGGPIKKDQHFFFFSYDGQRSKIPNLVFLNLPRTVPTDAATQSGIQTLSSLAQSWNRSLDQDTFLGKSDFQFGANHRLSVRYNQQNFTGEGFENGGAQNSFEHTGASLVKTNTFSGTFTSILSNRLINEARSQFLRDKEPGEANSDRPEATIQEGGQTVLIIGRNFFSPRETTIKRGQFADTVSYIAGQHSMKFGGDWNVDRIVNFFPGNFGGSYTFTSLASFAGGRPTATGERYVQAFAGSGTTGATTKPNLSEFAGFFQDDVQVTPKLTLNLGVRYDYQGIEQPTTKNSDPQLIAAGIDTSKIPTDKNNWAPRIGLAYRSGTAGKPLVLRAGYGLFYGRTPSIMIGTAHSNNGLNVQTITVTGTSVPTYPATLNAIPAGASAPTPTIFLFRQGLRQPVYRAR
jgi:outer membrane receptor protein involved in Fe transport